MFTEVLIWKTRLQRKISGTRQRNEDFKSESLRLEIEKTRKRIRVDSIDEDPDGRLYENLVVKETRLENSLHYSNDNIWALSTFPALWLTLALVFEKVFSFENQMILMIFWILSTSLMSLIVEFLYFFVKQKITIRYIAELMVTIELIEKRDNRESSMTRYMTDALDGAKYR